MALTGSQKKIARQIITAGKRSGASKKELIAGLETGLVESNLSNPAGGDGTSQGWRQETSSSYPGVNRRNVMQSAQRFFRETKQAGAGKGEKAGTLAQSVQRSAYPDRYQQRSAEAKAILNKLDAGTAALSGGSGKGVKSSRTTKIGTQTGQLPASTILSFINTPNKTASDYAGIKAAQSQVDAAAQAAAQQAATKSGKASKGNAKTQLATKTAKATKVDTSAKGTTNFEGTQVAAWIAPALQYARQHGWKGSVTSGFRSFADQTRIYNSGVRPAARPGTSNHEGSQFPRGAVDTSDAAQLSAILKNSPFRKKLVYAGSKDPVHFSHPHGGSY